MLSIYPCKAFGRALVEYLQQADYYSEGMKVKGYAFGTLCRQVGLEEGAIVADEAFLRIAGNQHAITGKRLTPRTMKNRRAGYDPTTNAPKSVSIKGLIGGDGRLIRCHDIATAEVFREMERFACYQHGRGINKRHLVSGQIVGSRYGHLESRALDPHIHTHGFMFAVTNDRAGRLLALETSLIFERKPYLTEVYRNALAREVQRLGYKIVGTEHGFELADVPKEIVTRFSKRAQERDALIAEREAKLGRELSHDEIALLVRESRPKKQYELTAEEVRNYQLSQVSEEELRQLQKRPASPQELRIIESLEEALVRAKAHVFERRTVVSVYDLAAETMRQAYGHFSHREVLETITAGRSGLMVDGDQVTTQAALDRERALVAQINAGREACKRKLGFSRDLANLSAEQKTAVETLLDSRDRVIVLRGRAGTGKTHTLATVIAGTRHPIACFASTTKAVEILKADGAQLRQPETIGVATALGGAKTVQRLLLDPNTQSRITNGVVIVDEYGALSLPQLKGLLDIAEREKARVILVGDSAQHKSVEAGDTARIVETETRVKIAELREVRRQSVNPAYRSAAEALAAGRTADGLQKLDAMGAIVEIPDPTGRRMQMVDEWFAAAQETKSVKTKDGEEIRPKTSLMVAPTWAEIDELNAHARVRLRRAGGLGQEEQTFSSLRAKTWTKAQQRDARNYAAGDVLVCHKPTKQFSKHDELRVVRREENRLVVSRGAEEFSVSPRQAGLAWTVCEERPMGISSGEQVRLRAVGRAETEDGKRVRLANGTTVTVQKIDAMGRLVLAGGAVLTSRQVVHGYAMTSHAAQGVTVDKVFIAGAASQEGLYVSATRGREMVRIFVADRELFLSAAGLRSEARMSALEFTRRAEDLRHWHYLQHVIAQSRAALPEHQRHLLNLIPEPVQAPVVGESVARHRSHRTRSSESAQPAQRIRI